MSSSDEALVPVVEPGVEFEDPELAMLAGESVRSEAERVGGIGGKYGL